MSEERTSSNPANLPEDTESRAAEPATPSGPARPRAQIAPDPGRVPAIPGLIASRFVSRLSVNGATAATSTLGSSEPAGLMRPKMPFKKPVPQVPEPIEGELSANGAEGSVIDSPPTAFAGGQDQSSVNVDFMDSRPGTPSKLPQAVSARHVPGPKRRPIPFPHPASTITAMRIISIGIEDDPLLSEMTTPLPEAPERPEATALPRLDVPPLPQLETQPTESVPKARDDANFSPSTARSLVAEGQVSAQHAWPPGTTDAAQFSAAATDNLKVGGGAQPPSLAYEPLPSFELNESFAEAIDRDQWLAREAPQLQPSVTTGDDAPLPAFELSETDESLHEAAVERLPAFELPDTSETAPREATSSAPTTGRISYPSPPLRPSPPPPPKTQRATAQPILLSEQDVAPDSARPAPPVPPSRAATGKSQPEITKQDLAASPPPRTCR